MSEREFTACQTTLFGSATLLTGQAAARWGSMARWQRFVRVVLVHCEQTPLRTTPNKDHGAAGAFAQPAIALERGDSGGEGAAQVGAGWQFSGVEHVVKHVAEHEPARVPGRGQGIVFAAFGGHARDVIDVRGGSSIQ